MFVHNQNPIRALLSNAHREHARTEPDPVDDPVDPPVGGDPVDPPVDPPADPDPVDDDEDEETPEELRARLKVAEAENADNKRKAAEAERKQKKADRAAAAAAAAKREDEGEFKSLYEQEKAKNEKQDSAMRKRLMVSSIKLAATSLKFRNPDAAVRLVDLDPMDVVDEDYSVDEQSIRRELEALAKTDPYLVTPGKAQGDLKPGQRERNGGGKPAAASSDDPTTWDPAGTMRNAYDQSTA